MVAEEVGLEGDYGLGMWIEAEEEGVDTEEIDPEPVRSINE